MSLIRLLLTSRHDLVHADANGQANIYGVPLTVDTLALYYNKDHYADKLAEIGRPSKPGLSFWTMLMS